MNNDKLKVKNFGPIKEAVDDFITINRLSVFIGDQGSGKSTIAKLISTFKWLEKALFRNDFNDNNFSSTDFILLCKNQNISEFFQSNTEIIYISDYYKFVYQNKNFKIKKTENSSRYLRPQIMYFPSERNLISVIEHSEKIQNLPPMLESLLNEFIKARKISNNGEFQLPISNYKLIYDSNKDTTKILETKSKKEVFLSNASSGLQSIVPLSIVIQYLEANVKDSIFNKLKVKSQSEKDEMIITLKESLNPLHSSVIDSALKKLNTFFQSGLTKQFTQSEIQSLEIYLGNYFNTISFYIVEEPEQNLFPTSQVEVLKELVSILNGNIRNSLLITTHSPYILSALNNYIYASSFEKKSESIVEKKLQISRKNVSSYIIEDGFIKNIMDDELGIIDTTVIDDCSSIINEVNDRLYALELE